MKKRATAFFRTCGEKSGQNLSSKSEKCAWLYKGFTLSVESFSILQNWSC